MKIVKKNQLKIVIFTAVKKSLYIAWACFCNEADPEPCSVHFLGVCVAGSGQCHYILEYFRNVPFCIQVVSSKWLI